MREKEREIGRHEIKVTFSREYDTDDGSDPILTLFLLPNETTTSTILRAKSEPIPRESRKKNSRRQRVKERQGDTLETYDSSGCENLFEHREFDKHKIPSATTVLLDWIRRRVENRLVLLAARLHRFYINLVQKRFGLLPVS